MIKIYVKEKVKGWVQAEHKTWQEVIDDGWVFIGLTLEGKVLMIRKGYINEWEQRSVKE